MTALADFSVTQVGLHADHGPGRRGPGPAAVPAAGRSGAVRDQAKTVRSWPLLVLAVPAAAEVWSGWVGIAQLTGFGTVPLLPGIWPSLRLDTAVTLPVGVECYAAYALRAWLAGGHAISDRTRRFARWSAICSFALGMAGQVAFHLMDQDHVTRAPWGITTLVSCLPVLVLGMGTALAHMLREDAAAADQSDGWSGGPADAWPPDWSAEDQSSDQPDRPRDQDHGPDLDQRPDQDPPEQVRHQQAGTRTTVRPSWSPRTSASTPPAGSAVPLGAAGRVVSSSPDQGSSGVLGCTQASHGRETRVPAGTAQRRGERVQRESERTRAPAQCRIRQRAGHRFVGSQGQAAPSCCLARREASASARAAASLRGRSGKVRSGKESRSLSATGISSWLCWQR